MNVELKTFPEADPALRIAVFAAIDASETANRVLLSSFDHSDVAAAVQARPQIASGVLTETPLHREGEYVRRLVGADFLHMSAAATGAESRAYRTDPAARNLRTFDDTHPPVLVYTVNDARRGGLAAHLRSAGVAGLFSDDPRQFAPGWPEA